MKKADITTLKEAIAKAAEIKEEEVTPSSWERVQAAKAAAEKVVADFEKDETSVTQSQIDAAAKALQDALDSVQKRADFTALQEAVDRISKLQLDGYTEESVKVLKDALKEAEAVLEEQEATQNTVDEMLTKLLAAEEALTKEETIEKADLEDLINYAKAQQSKEEYKYLVPVVKERFEKALAEAETIYGKADATQEEVNVAYDKLLQMVHYLDFTGNSESLKVLVDAAKGLNEKLYTEKSWAVFEDALTKAEAVLADTNALQEEIDAAREALHKAMDQLVKVPVDKSKLQTLVEKSKKYEDKLKEESGAVLRTAIANAKAVFADENATETDVKNAEKELKTAMKGLKVASNDEKDNQGNSNGGTSASKADENSPKTRDAAPVAATGAVMLAAFALVVAMRKRR